MKPVTGGTSNKKERRPETGVRLRVFENKIMSKSPHQNIGIEYPVKDILMIPWSTQVPLLIAAIMPAGIPIIRAKRIAHKPSSAVAGKSSKNSSTTGLFVIREVPKSP